MVGVGGLWEKSDVTSTVVSDGESLFESAMQRGLLVDRNDVNGE